MLSKDEIYNLCKICLGKFVRQKDDDFLNSLCEYFTKFIFQSVDVDPADDIPLKKLRDCILKVIVYWATSKWIYLFCRVEKTQLYLPCSVVQTFNGIRRAGLHMCKSRMKVSKEGITSKCVHYFQIDIFFFLKQKKNEYESTWSIEIILSFNSFSAVCYFPFFDSVTL